MNHQAKKSYAHDLPCVWMEAGLVAYKLCDRDLECEGCPFDAALRGQSEPTHAQHVAPMTFPEDRCYTPGHQWIRTLPHGRIRTGVDAMIGQLAGPIHGVRRVSPRARRGGPLFEIELQGGPLQLCSIADASRVRMNRRALERPETLSTEPYGEGWIAELEHVDAIFAESLLTAAQARTQARLDVRAVRRRVALFLLSDAEDIGPTLADGGIMEKDIASMIGARRYLEILREVVY